MERLSQAVSACKVTSCQHRHAPNLQLPRCAVRLGAAAIGVVTK